MQIPCNTTPNLCTPGIWPASNLGAFYEPSAPADHQAWFGSLTTGKTDASGFMYMRNRYYNPQTGTFTQPDPIGIAGGLNVYGFAAGDPVSYGDPFGLKPCLDSGVIAWFSCQMHLMKVAAKLPTAGPQFTVMDGVMMGLAAWGEGEMAGGDEGAEVDEAEQVVAGMARVHVEEESVTAGSRGVPRRTTWGWSGAASYRAVLNAVGNPEENATLGAAELGGKVPTRLEAEHMIAESGGRISRVERPHTGVGHKVPHINYVGANGRKATIEVQSVGRQYRAP